MTGVFKKAPFGIDILDLLQHGGCLPQNCKCIKHKSSDKENNEYFLVTYECFKKMVFNGSLRRYIEMLKRDHFFPSKISLSMKAVAENSMNFKSYFAFLKIIKQCVRSSFPTGFIDLHSVPNRERGTRSTGRIIVECVHIKFSGIYHVFDDKHVEL